MVARLTHWDAGASLPDAARAVQWAHDLDQLVRQGDAGVAAMAEFLSTGSNSDFGSWGRTNVGFSTPRVAFFDALAKIGTPSAVALLGATLQTTLEPAEIGTALRGLDALVPGQYAEVALDAARQALAVAGRGALPERDLAPAFEILQKYGGAEAAPELEKLSEKYVYYSTMALAALPDNAGLSVLAAMAKGEGERSFAVRLAAQQMLALLAPAQPEAREALLTAVCSNVIAPSGWKFVGMALEGKRFAYENGVLDPPPAGTAPAPSYRAHILSGNQHYVQTTDPAAANPAWRERQLALLDQMLAVAKSEDGVAQLRSLRLALLAPQTKAEVLPAGR